jgi:hypothetical protein
MKKHGRSTSFYITDKGMSLLNSVAQTLGISKSAVLEILIREKAKEEGIKFRENK